MEIKPSVTLPKNELMNLMNLFWDSAAELCFCNADGSRPVTKQSENPGKQPAKFISSLRKTAALKIRIISSLINRNRSKKYEFMKRYEQTWGLFPAFAMGDMNMRFLNELRNLQVHSNSLEVHRLVSQFDKEREELSMKGEVGLLWTLVERKSLVENAIAGIERHRVKYGTEPTVINANPDDLKGDMTGDHFFPEANLQGPSGLLTVMGIPIKAVKSCQAGYLFIGREIETRTKLSEIEEGRE